MSAIFTRLRPAIVSLGLLGCALATPSARAGAIVLHTDTGQVTVDGFSVTQINGVDVFAWSRAAIRTFVVAGDLNLLAGDTLSATGDSGVSLLVGNNVNIAAGAAIDIIPGSNGGGAGAVGGALGGDGGGGGGGGGTGGSNGGGGGSNGGSPGTGGGVSPKGGNGGDDGKGFDNGKNGSAGGSRISGSGGTLGGAGAPGSAGGNAVLGGGGAGAGGGGGTGGASGIGGSISGGGGGGGAGQVVGGSAASKGGDGVVGKVGGDGFLGENGNGGSGGLNTGTGTNLTGGGGGGAGGGGGGGGGAGGASSGGAGGGGGGGQGVAGTAGAGGGGGGGGKGGGGGTGGTGGIGGAGGGGGGAIRISAHGIITLDGTLSAAGSDGSGGSAGTTGSQGAPGGPGGHGGVGGTGSGGGGNGGKGGEGAQGGHGGIGGNGGTGGGGGGGAGGTVNLYGSVVNGSGTVDLSGGSGAAGGVDGGGGRFILGHNFSGLVVPFSGTVVGDPDFQGTAGSRGANPLTGSPGFTPYIPNLVDGAELFGLTTSSLADVATAMGGSLPALDVNGVALSDAVGALVRVHVGPVGYDNDFPGFDTLLYLNLSTATIDSPKLAIDGSLEQLLLGGFAKSPIFVPTAHGYTDLNSLDAGGVYATMVRAGDTSNFQISLASGGLPYTSTAGSLVNGQALYVVPEPATWVLLGIGALGLLLAARRGRRWGLPVACGLLMCLGQFASTCEGSYIYAVNAVDLGGGYELSEGFIETDINSGELALANILDYEIVVTGPLPFTFSPANPGHEIYLSGTVSVTPEEIVVPVAPDDVPFLNFNGLDFFSFDEAFQSGVFFDNATSSKIRGPKTTIGYYYQSSTRYDEAEAGFNPPVPIQIAAAVPEPATWVLLGIGALGLPLLARRRGPRLLAAAGSMRGLGPRRKSTQSRVSRDGRTMTSGGWRPSASPNSRRSPSPLPATPTARAPFSANLPAAG